MSVSRVSIFLNTLLVAPFDAKIRDRNPFGLPLPIVLSGDIVGVVVGSGPGVLFPIGTHIFVQMDFNNLGGGLQEYTIVDGRYAGVVPQEMADTEAALYPINAVTSAKCLFTPEGLGFPFPGTAEAASYDFSSKHIVIIGGGTNCGKLAIQLAKLAGIGTIVAIASASNESSLRDFGATHIINRKSSNIKNEVRTAVGGEVLRVYDAYGDLDVSVSLLSEQQKGTLVHITKAKVSDEVLANKKGQFDQKFVQGASGSNPVFGRQFWTQFPVWLEAGDIKPLKYNIIEGMDVDKVNEVLDSYHDGKGGDRYHVRLSA